MKVFFSKKHLGCVPFNVRNACIIWSLFDIRLQRRWNDARERCGC